MVYVQISLLIHMGDEFTTEDFCTVICDEFFYAGISRENVVRHLLKLLWYVYPKLSTTRLHTLMKVLQPNAQVNRCSLVLSPLNCMVQK